MDQAQGLRDWMAQMSERERTKMPEHVSIKFTDEPWIQDGVVMGSETVVTYLGQRVGTWRRDNLAEEARKIIEARLAVKGGVVSAKDVARHRAEIQSCRANLSQIRDRVSSERLDGLAHTLNAEIARLYELLTVSLPTVERVSREVIISALRPVFEKYTEKLVNDARKSRNGIDRSEFADALIDLIEALATLRAESSSLSINTLLDAIERGDDRYKSSQIHGQAFWRDCIESEIAPIVGSLGAESESDGWVSVTERLPDVDPCAVNVTAEGEVLGAVFANGEFHLWTADGLVTFDNITHWRPLPTPPRSA